MARIPIIAGNWKMNLTRGQAIELVDGIRFGLPFPGETDVIVSPPSLCLEAVARHLVDSYIAVAAQNLHQEDSGAFTGECSASQVRDAGADYVIIGHSERRQYFNETDAIVKQKLNAAFRHHLIPIMCIGETLEERESGEVSTVIQRQLIDGLAGLGVSEADRLIIAYEPVWAIGTGKTATPDQAEEVHGFIRLTLASQFGQLIADSIRILYGGSVKPANTKELMALPNVDGALVGGASLKAPDFIAIIESLKN